MTASVVFTLTFVACAIASVSSFQPVAQSRSFVDPEAQMQFHRSSALTPEKYGNQAGSRLFIESTPVSDKSLRLYDSVIGQIDTKIKKYEQKELKYKKKQLKYSTKIETINKEIAKYHNAKQRYDEAGLLGTSGASFSETTARSIVKSMMWRVIAGGVTFLTSLRFSGSISTALSIVGSDFFSKAMTMFIGERIMNKSQAGRKSGADGIRRSLAKALLWRLFAIFNTLTMSFFISKNLGIASKIAGSDAVFKTGLMFVYERVWAKIEWGKDYSIEFLI